MIRIDSINPAGEKRSFIAAATVGFHCRVLRQGCLKEARVVNYSHRLSITASLVEIRIIFLVLLVSGVISVSFNQLLLTNN